MLFRSPGYDSNMWWGIMVPAKTPAATVQKLNRDIKRAAAAGEVAARFADLGMEVRVSTPDEFSSIVAADIKKWAAIIKAANVTAGAQ